MLQSPRARAPGTWRAAYLGLLAWAFAFFNAVRLLTYVPTMWAIHQSASSDQHSLLTWAGWALANLTMALWLYERAQRVDGAVVINFGNAAMCGAVTLLIAWYRL
jgi:hypothetical protein